MMLPKQPISLFFGATDQDTSKKRAQLGDMVTAENCRQVKGGEFSKRDGFTQTQQSYLTSPIVSPDSIISPDGVQVLTKDAATGHAYARSATSAQNQDQGHADRFVPYVRTRFPATGSGLQAAPMAKQAGNYVAWLIDEGHFVVAQVNPGVLGSPTDDAETIVQQTNVMSVAGISNGASSKIKSFALIDWPAFDNVHVWFLWVDWSGSIFAYRMSHANLLSGTCTTVWTFPQAGTIYPALTSISAGIIADGANGTFAIAVCGVNYETGIWQAHEQATSFRMGLGACNVAQTICAHMYLTASTGQAQTNSIAYYQGDWGKMTAAACTLASMAGGFQTSSAYWYYTFLGNWGSNTCIVLVKVPLAAPGAFQVYSQAVSFDAPDTYGLPADWSASNYSHFGWFYNAQIAAKETATGVDVAVTVIPYYTTMIEVEGVITGSFKAWNPDYLFTECWSFAAAGGTWSRKWKKLGCCVAQGWMRLRDYSVTGAGALTSGKDYLLTIWEDKDAYQTCYHVREWETGEILAQLAYGEAAHVGHVATRDLQAQGYYSDVQAPMLAGVNQQGGLPLSIIVGLQSQNQNASVDIAAIILQTWDFVTGAPPIWQNPTTLFQLALTPGPIPTVHNGFQALREAGPLVYPSRPETYVGAGNELMASTDPILDGDTTIAVVYRLTDSDGRITRSSPYILANSLYWENVPGGTTDVDSRVRIPMLRHLMAGTVAEVELYIGQVDLQLFAVYPNDPTVNYLDVLPAETNPPAGYSFSTIKNAVESVGPGEDLYTTGGALEATAPPIARCAYQWRNRIFLANETNIYPSQEFAPGLGAIWNEVTRISWTEGTGDILAICHIDWNYLAVFKRDAIGIISGPGPDGMGTGNYIVQTLSTKAGCVNVKSVVNGADGIYYQDSQTGRLMLLNASLQVQEAAPGAFDASSSPITCAMHVEAQRQVWFFAAGSTNKLIVLDYKHRTQTCPCGSVYQWSILGGLYAVNGMAIVNGAPMLIFSDGTTAVQVANQWQDIWFTGVGYAVLQHVKTADHNPIGLQRQFNLCKVQMLGEYVAPHGLTVTVTPDYIGTPSVASIAMTAAPEQVSHRPANCMRIQAASLDVQETLAYTNATPPVAIVGAGFKFTGFAFVVQDYGKVADLSTGRII